MSVLSVGTTTTEDTMSHLTATVARLSGVDAAHLDGLTDDDLTVLYLGILSDGRSDRARGNVLTASDAVLVALADDPRTPDADRAAYDLALIRRGARAVHDPNRA
jgi:hypothetical protein